MVTDNRGFRHRDGALSVRRGPYAKTLTRRCTPGERPVIQLRPAKPELPGLRFRCAHSGAAPVTLYPWTATLLIRETGNGFPVPEFRWGTTS
jgi:hypothetical protein